MIINDPEFSAFVFNCMSHASKKQLSELDLPELKYFSSTVKMQRFADTADIETRMSLLARLGYSFCFVVAPDPFPRPDLFDEIATQNRVPAKRKEIVKAMAEERIFVISSRETLISAHMAAQNCHAGVYILNAQYLRMKHELDKVKDSIIQRDQRDAIRAFDALAPMVLGTLNSREETESLCGLAESDLRILLAMYPSRETFVRLDTIATRLGLANTNLVRVHCKKLASMNFLLSLPGESGLEYMIMEKGINAALQYMKYIVKQKQKFE